MFLPFVHQCDNVEYVNSNPICDGCEVSSDSQSLISDFIFYVKVYFVEESESVIDLIFQIKNLFDTSILNDLGAFLLLFSSLFSILLVLFSLFGLYKVFKNKMRNISKVYLTNLILVVLILVINAYIFIDRIGQIKIGFYLLLITNFYLFIHYRKLKIDK
ncbi:hypothetical protein FBBAL38_01225 [Flavobacteria bacterium BAL38]|nr:hypothetical protein FBBAL38_01225 [Flavobacteria bacterium BAL38]